MFCTGKVEAKPSNKSTAEENAMPINVFLIFYGVPFVTFVHDLV